jgi:hypothetical protein
MNTQLIESLVETIRTLSPIEQEVLWHRLDHVPTAENSLLQKISQTVPTSIQVRYDDLRSKLQAETITPEEHQELLNHTEIIEQFDADRLQNLLTLAGLRQVSLPELMEQLKIETPAVYV